MHHSFPVHGDGVVTNLVLSKNRVISASDDHTICVHDLATRELRHTFEHEGGVWALAVKDDILVSGSTDATLRIWDLSGGRCTHVFCGHTGTVRCVAIVKPEWIETEGGAREKWPKRALVITGSRDRTLRVWTLPRYGDPEYSNPDVKYSNPDDPKDNPYHRHILEGHENAIRALAARGRTAVSGSYDHTLRVWDLETGVCRWVLVGHTGKVYSAVLDLPRQKAFSGSMDGTVRTWDLKTGQCVHTLTGHTSLIGLLALTPRTLVSGAADATLRVWDPDTGALRHTLAGLSGAITCFQHDEGKVVSGCDATLRIWNLKDGSVMRDLKTGASGVWQVAFQGRWCIAATSQTIDDAPQTVMEVWDFSEEEAWASEPLEGEEDVSDGE
ncbi:cell division control protein 4 [Mycena polygramma]|nr:cell division control protein 4 [Mycena polygramma]